MRQVPTYAIVGNGRMARHFCHYLQLLNVPYVQWTRNESSSNLKEKIQATNRVLLLISDHAIEPFIAAHPYINEKMIIHFSGRLVSQRAHSAHPLMTFSSKLYHFEEYKNIPFIIEQDGPSFLELLPGLPNDFYAIPQHQKAYYHTLCVMANNFSTLLWQKFFNEMDERFHIPKSALLPYLNQTFHNLSHHHQEALTGPLARGDQETISANLHSLNEIDDPFLLIYQAFMNVAQKKGEEKK